VQAEKSIAMQNRNIERDAKEPKGTTIKGRMSAPLVGGVLGLASGVLALALPPTPSDLWSVLERLAFFTFLFAFLSFLGGPKLLAALMRLS
jgi:hypothetical protein